MVGILVVSHSAKAAAGIREIALQMGGEGAQILAVGGDVDGGIGTSVTAIQEALEELAAETDGIVVVADLGSAIMNAEHAIEELDLDVEIAVADAPILEGTLNAAVTAASPTADLETVLRSAEEAADLATN